MSTLPITISDRHSKFMEKARRLNRTKLFLGTVDAEAKKKLASSIAEADLKHLLSESGGGQTQSSINKLNKPRLSSPAQQHSGLLSREIKEFKAQALFEEENRGSHTHTSLGSYGKDARSLFLHTENVHNTHGHTHTHGRTHSHAQTQYDGFDKTRNSLHSRSVLAHEHSKTGGTGVDIDRFLNDFDKDFDGFNSTQLAQHNRMHQQSQLHDQLRNPDDDFLASTQGQLKQHQYQHHHQQQYHNTETDTIAHNKYDSSHPLPINYTNQHRANPNLHLNHGRDYEEKMGAALADSVLLDVKSKYSVTAVRSMYRRRRETDEQEGRKEYNRKKESLKPEKKVTEWKERRVDQARKRRVGRGFHGEDDVVEEGEEEEEEREQIRKIHIITGLTMKQLSTDPYFKVSKENEAREKLKGGTDVLLRSNTIENGGTATDSRLSLQFLASGLFRELEGGMIPPAQEIMGDGIPSGDWEMLLVSKVDAKAANKVVLVKYDCLLPRFENRGEVVRATTAYM